MEAARQNAAACVAANGVLLDHVGTADAVMDVEAIRLALGGEQITYVGFSYGTLIGLRYAERFQGSLRAMALDGTVDPRQTLTAASIDRSLAAVLAACDAGCPIEGDALEGTGTSSRWPERNRSARTTAGRWRPTPSSSPASR